jgi:hypothetical protein
LIVVGFIRFYRCFPQARLAHNGLVAAAFFAGCVLIWPSVAAKLTGARIPAIRENKVKHLIYAVVAVSAVGFSAGAYANCGAQHTAAADHSIVVAQKQVQGTPTTQSTEKQGGATTGQSK